MSSIYIAIDHTKPNICKVGMTTRSVYKRITETENPDYELYKSFEVISEEREIEAEIHACLENLYARLSHKASGRKSEWFMCSTQQAEFMIKAVIHKYYDSPNNISSPLKHKDKLELNRIRYLEMINSNEEQVRIDHKCNEANTIRDMETRKRNEERLRVTHQRSETNRIRDLETRKRNETNRIRDLETRKRNEERLIIAQENRKVNKHGHNSVQDLYQKKEDVKERLLSENCFQSPKNKSSTYIDDILSKYE